MVAKVSPPEERLEAPADERSTMTVTGRATSNPSPSVEWDKHKDARVAQLAERTTLHRVVVGSSPTSGAHLFHVFGA